MNQTNRKAASLPPARQPFDYGDDPSASTAADPPFTTVPVRGGREALIDVADLEVLKLLKLDRKWYLRNNGAGRAYLHVDRKVSPAGLLPDEVKIPDILKATDPRICLARLIMNAQADQLVNYRNGDKLDLRRSNLVLINRSPSNVSNSSREHNEQ